MNVIVAGAGEVGGHAAEVLSAAGHNVTVIDLSTERLSALSDKLDLRTLKGNCTHFDVLSEAGVARCDALVAATQIDELNLLCASLAKAAGATKTIVRVHHAGHFKLRHTRYAADLGIDELICPEHLTALAIARMLRNPGAIAIEEFGAGQVVIERVPVGKGAQAVGKRLPEIGLPGNVRVATVSRGSGTLIADAQTVIGEGDLVMLFGESKRFDAARKLFHKGKAKHQHIVIMGEAGVAVWLCRVLKSRIFSVRLFVDGRERAEELSTRLDRVTVLDADPTDEETFADEHIKTADAFVAAMEDDESNILACAQARTLGADRSVAVLQRAKYLHLLPHVGIAHAFSPRHVAVRAMMNLIQDDPIRSLATSADKIVEVFEVTPTLGAEALGPKLRDIKLPVRTMIAAIKRENDVRVPGADDTVVHGDTVLVIGPPGIENGLRKLFVSK